MAELLSVPLKKPSDVDVVKPLKNLIRGSFSTADRPEDYSDEILEFSKMRTAAIWRVFEKYESSLDVIYGYYDQLVVLENKLPAQEVQIPFKWKDAFDKGSIFGAKIRLTISSLAYERVCVLFNIAALQSAVAASQSLDNDEGLKLAAKLFQQAAGIFAHLKATVMVAIHQEPTPDLNPDTLHALSQLMLAQAQEIFVKKAVQDKMKDAVVAKLCSQAEELYAEVLKTFQKEFLRHLWDKDWIPTVAGKQAAYHALAEYYQSLVCKSNKQIGEEIARLEHASELIKAAQSRSGKTQFFADYATKIERNLTEAKKDNDFIYHERIPDAKNLPPLGKALLAKQLPMPEKFSSNFKDLFEKLCPVAIHQALAAFDVRKADIVNSEINKLREATNALNRFLISRNLPAAVEPTRYKELPQSIIDKSEAVKGFGGIRELLPMIESLGSLNRTNEEILNEANRFVKYHFSILASLNLPAAIENTSGNELPPSLLDKGDSLKQEGGINSLQTTINELPELLQRNKDILDEADRMLGEEKASDDQLREQFKEKWTRTPSDKLTDTFRSNAAKYREIINNAVKADQTVREKFTAHRRGMELLSLPREEMQNAVPSSGPQGTSVQQSPVVQQLRKLMEEVDTIKAEREVIESELKSATVDMKSSFLNALAADGAISEAALSTETLGRMYGPLQKQVQESLQRQEVLVASIQSAHSQFAQETAGQPSRREAVLKELAAAYDAYMELKNNLQEGSKFYNDLTQLLVSFQNKISDFCFARKTEKEELLKDLTQEASRPGQSRITVPSHFPSNENSSGSKVPPPRPPPPSVPTAASTSNPPYPGGYPPSMPVPYGAAPMAPYPTYAPPPMPQGYNPYGTLPYPIQGGYSPYPQPPQGYPYPTQPQAPPHHPHQNQQVDK